MVVDIKRRIEKRLGTIGNKTVGVVVRKNKKEREEEEEEEEKVSYRMVLYNRPCLVYEAQTGLLV